MNFSEYQIQQNNLVCGSYVWYIIHLTEVMGTDFRSSVLRLYYEMI